MSEGTIEGDRVDAETALHARNGERGVARDGLREVHRAWHHLRRGHRLEGESPARSLVACIPWSRARAGVTRALEDFIVALSP